MRGNDDVTGIIIGEAIAIHRELGPGLLESTYETCLASTLSARGLPVERQVALPVVFRGQRLDCAYRIDLLVDGHVIVELKTVTSLESLHFAQVMTYLKFSGCPVALLINFNVLRLTDGLRRIVRGHTDALAPSSVLGGPRR